MTQQGDVLLFQTIDDGNIIVWNGLIAMTQGFETAAYLSLFGGNEEDDGSQDSPFNWWGNIGEPDPNKHYRSETQNLLESLPLTVNNLRRVEDAANRDLAWFILSGAASGVTAVATIPGVNKIKISILIIAADQEYNLEFIEAWGAVA